MSELAPGTSVSQHKAFEIVEGLGEGGMGKIYKAYDASMDRYVALKVLKPNVPESERRRFHREAVLAANFSHPNLVRVLETGQHGELRWLAMEYLRGRDVGHVLTSGKQVSFRVLCDIFAQTLDALTYIHTRKIAHCDIKPENIFITRDAYDRRLVIVKLIDFGISSNYEGPRELRKHITGDPRYMAPEQAVLNGPIDHRTDLYALGVTFCEAVTGRHPFEDYFGEGPKKLLALHRTVEIQPPSKFLPEHTPAHLADMIDRFTAFACAKNPAARFSSAQEMKTMLLRCLDVLQENDKARSAADGLPLARA
ncbi:MAG: serine/threonine-protein kinase [Nannocystaceae bacterium]